MEVHRVMRTTFEVSFLLQDKNATVRRQLLPKHQQAAEGHLSVLSATASCPCCMQILFRSANKLLMDTATSEFLFCADFFSESAIFHELFSATLNAVETALATSLQVDLPEQ